jgi:hypothetical protein
VPILDYDGSMRRSGWRGVAVAAAVGFIAMPESAEACSWQTWVELLRPRAGEVHPAGASLLFFNNGGEPTELYSAAVDGQPAALVVELEEIFGVFTLIRIEPPPHEGQVVTVSQCGGLDDPQHQSCDPNHPFGPIFDFTVGPPDDVAPPTAGNVSLAHELGAFEYFCYEEAELRFDVEVTDLDQGDETSVVYLVEIRSPNGSVVTEEAVFFDEPGTDLFVDEFLLEAPPDAADHCASVTALDLSGNATLVAEVCGSSDLGPDTTTGGETTGAASTGTTSGDDGTPDHTTTTNEAEDSDGSTTDAAPEGDDTVERGCACTSAQPPTTSLLMLTLLGLRRRARARCWLR